MHESINRPATVSFRCPGCKGENVWDVTVAPYRLTVDDPQQAIGISETVVPCPDCPRITYEIVVENHGSTVKAFVRDHPQIKVAVESYEATNYEDFLFSYYPLDPIRTFENARLDLENLIYQTPHQVQSSTTFARMIFLQWMGMMEAYLADRLIGVVLEDREIMMNLIRRAGLHQNQKFDLLQIAQDSDFVRNTVKTHLQHVIYHDVEKVERLYLSVFEGGIYTDETRTYFLDKAKIRHHFVHRNGRDKEGNFVPLTTQEALGFGKMVDQLIGKCENQYQDYRRGKGGVIAYNGT